MSLPSLTTADSPPCKTYLARIQQEMSDMESISLELLNIYDPESMPPDKVSSRSMLLYYSEDRLEFYNNVLVEPTVQLEKAYQLVAHDLQDFLPTVMGPNQDIRSIFLDYLKAGIRRSNAFDWM